MPLSYRSGLNILLLICVAGFLFTSFNTSDVKKTFLIQLWTDAYGEKRSLATYCLENNIYENCEFNNCIPTIDRNLLGESDAVVFHTRDLKKEDLPLTRKSSQYWVFFIVESQKWTWVELKPFTSLFNWTMTHMSNSDIVTTYGTVKKRDSITPINFTLRTKRKIAVIARSNCKFESSGRGKLLNELSKLIEIDQYGDCGKLKCPQGKRISLHRHCNPSDCYSFLGEKYKFYLAFENSFSRDYLTEKFFSPLVNGLIPVVFGAANYSMFGPPNSFIDAQAFPNTQALAEYLQYLDQNDTAYGQYHKWRENYIVKDTPIFQQAFCSLCKKLNEDYGEVSIIKDVKKWWFQRL